MSTPTIYTPKRLIVPALLTAGNVTYYTSPAGKAGTQIKVIVLDNTTTSATTVTLYLVPNGGTAGSLNTLLNAVALPVDGTPYVLEFADSIYMNASDTIQALASNASRVAIHITGVELE